jgi:flagellar operon protein
MATQVNSALLTPLAPAGGEVQSVSGSAAPGAARFGELMRAAGPAVSFSQHALQRVQRRGIDVSPQTLPRLLGGVGRAAATGARDSVVFVNGTAFVVSVTNRTVITAVDQAHMRDFVFTNIDSAVIA